jgi:hypothetical protein
VDVPVSAPSEHWQVVCNLCSAETASVPGAAEPPSFELALRRWRDLVMDVRRKCRLGRRLAEAAVLGEAPVGRRRPSGPRLVHEGYQTPRSAIRLARDFSSMTDIFSPLVPDVTGN